MPRPTIIGEPQEVERLLTGLHSFDRAWINYKGDIGFPYGKGLEFFGPTHCGKSTAIYGLAGIVANILKTNIVLADLEIFDPKFLGDVLETVGFGGTVNYIQSEYDQDALTELSTVMREDEYGVGILDSIGAISPLAEQESDFGESNMGRRGFLMAQFSRDLLHLMKFYYPKTFFAINHAYQRIGGKGLVAPGGKVKEFLLSMRVQVKRRYWKGKDTYPDGSYILDGTVKKNRWGLRLQEFALFILSGKGIHKGLTAMFDCIDLGIATSDRVIKIGDKSFGRMKKITDEAQQGNEEFFQPFIDLLISTEVKTEEKSENEGNTVLEEIEK